MRVQIKNLGCEIMLIGVGLWTDMILSSAEQERSWH